MKLLTEMMLILICFLAPLLVPAATITTKDGRIIEGEINHMTLLRDLGQDGTGAYYIFQHDNIQVVDKEGIHLGGDMLAHFSCSKEGGGVVSDSDAIKYIEDNSKSSESGGQIQWGSAGGVSCVGLAWPVRIKIISDAKILGRLRLKEGKLEFLPALEIITPHGALELPVVDIVEYPQKEP